MPDPNPDPAHPLDAALRSQAAKRRAELGEIEPTMPGTMRAQLQDELSRKQRRDERAQLERPGFLAWFFQRQRALATVGATLLLLGFFAWNDGWFARRPIDVAKQEAPSAKALPAENSVVATEKDALAKRADAPASTLDEKEQSKPAPVISAPSDAAVASGKLEAAPKVAQPAAPSVAAAAPPVSEPRSEAFATKSAAAAGLRQNFVQSPSQLAERARRSPAKESKDGRTAPVLNEFEFRQTGNRIEIVDADGSIYAGEVELRLKKDKGVTAGGRDQGAARPSAGVAMAPESKAKNEGAAAQFNFRASGLNNTLRQQVTIEGVYQGLADADSQNSPGAAAVGGATAQDALKAAKPQLQRQNQSRARVVGRAQVNGREVEVNAEATK